MSGRGVVACVAVLVACAAGRADDADVRKAARAKAEEFQSALIKGDYEKFADLSHPKVIAGSGGRKKMIETTAAEMKAMKAGGTEFKAAKMGDASEPVAAGETLYVCVPFTLEIANANGLVGVKSALLGVSADGGKTWLFVDAFAGRESLKKSFPDLPEKLEFPKKEPPTLIKGKE
jgi:hypothetical protein